MNRFFISRGKNGFFEKNFDIFPLFTSPESAIFIAIHGSLLHTHTCVSSFSRPGPFSGLLPVKSVIFYFLSLYLRCFSRDIMHTPSCVSIYRYEKGAFPAPVPIRFNILWSALRASTRYGQSTSSSSASYSL